MKMVELSRAMKSNRLRVDRGESDGQTEPGDEKRQPWKSHPRASNPRNNVKQKWPPQLGLADTQSGGGARLGSL